jgi:hypothetical protein
MTQEIKKSFDIAPYYKLEVENNNIKIFSFSGYGKTKSRELTQWADCSGYLRVRLKNKGYTVHELVAKYCIGEKPSRFCVIHKDGDKLNNNPNNLEYVSLPDMIKNSIKLGKHVTHNPEKHGNYKHGRAIKETNSAYKQQWYCENKEEILIKEKKRYSKNPENHRKNLLKKAYNLTLEDYDNMFSSQNGFCKICGVHQTELKSKLCVDHNHETGKVRGLLCMQCNFGLGVMKEKISNFENAIIYLKENI